MNYRPDEPIDEPWRYSAWYQGLTTLAWLTFAGLLFLSLLPYIGWQQQLELLSHFRFQAALLSLLLPPVFLLLKRNLALVAALLLVAWNAFEVLPWYLPEPDKQDMSSAQGKPIKLLMANMLYENPDTVRLRQLIEYEKPDIVILEELHQRHVGLMKDFRDYKHSLHDTFKPAFGLGIWSKLPLQGTEKLFLGPAGIPSIYARLPLRDNAIHILATHPYPPVNHVAFDMRNQQFTALNAFLAKKSGSHLLIGDLNVTPWSPYYRRLAEDGNLRNARIHRGLLPSWPTHLPEILRIPIDHALVSPGLQVLDFRLGPELGSDHLPILLTIAP